MRIKPASRPYIQDVAYHSNFQAVQSPVAMSFVAASQGFAAPDPAQPFRYLELGCGQGATLNGLAAACPQGEFIGVDFNAGLIDSAREAARAAGLSNVRYIEAAFSMLATRELAGCDYLACNGTYSWLVETEKEALRRVADETLRNGGLFYLGYATLGRHAITPMWHILRQLVPASDASSLERLRTGVELLLKLRDQGAVFLRDHPQVLGVLSAIEGQLVAGDRSALENLAHNALAEAYSTALVDEVAADLAPLGLGFCGSADVFLNDPDLCVPKDVRVEFDRLATRIQRELLKDFIRSPLGRRDLFIRNAIHESGAGETWLEERAQATLTLSRAAAWQQVSNAGWTTFRYSAPEIEFVFERLADGATGLREIAEGCVYTGAQLRDAFLKLVACPGIEACLGPPAIPPIGATSSIPPQIQPASMFNRLALQSAGPGTSSIHLASPVLGSCIELPGQEAQHLASLCAQGSQAPGAEAGSPFRQWFLTERLPLLLRLRTVTPA